MRHFLHGQRFFEQELGVRCREFWSPDAFGYNGQLPQILREVGITRFLTQKLSWNRFNRPEQHTFTWQGVDGSEVLGHFPPADTYSSDATVPELLRTAREYADHDRSARSLLLFGYGDGGGGPTQGDARDAPPGSRPAGPPAHAALDERRVLRGARGRAGRAAGRRRRALLRVPPRRLHLAGAHEAR